MKVYFVYVEHLFQRTFEESVEEFVLQQVGAHPKDSNNEAIKYDTEIKDKLDTSCTTADVDRKIVEQILEFESQSEGKKKESLPIYKTLSEAAKESEERKDENIARSEAETQVARIEVTSENGDHLKLEVSFSMAGNPRIPSWKSFSGSFISTFHILL